MFPAPDIADPAPRERLLTVDEVAQWLQMSRMWVYKHSGRTPQQPAIPSLLCGSSRRFRARDVEAFIEEQIGAVRRQLTAVAKDRRAR
jgi:predicted DNA-binding transcriptional regulator AlpA